MKRSPQLKLLKSQKSSYGGELFKTRKGRSTPRPLDTRNTMHLVLRSSKATGNWSFKRPINERKITEVATKFAVKYGVKIHSIGNVGNHLHFQIKLGNRFSYRPFIRAITASIAMSVTGASRWRRLDQIMAERDISQARAVKSKSASEPKTTGRSKLASESEHTGKSKSASESEPKGEPAAMSEFPPDELKATNVSKKFWDYRPFTRVVQSFRGFLNLRDYIEINQLEGFGADRRHARFIVADAKIRPWKYNTG
jgi:hypothetical protein